MILRRNGNNESMRMPIPKNVSEKLFSTNKLLTKKPNPPLTKRTEEFKLAISGRYFSGKSVKTVDMPLCPIVHPMATRPKMAQTTKTGYVRTSNIVAPDKTTIPTKHADKRPFLSDKYPPIICPKAPLTDITTKKKLIINLSKL